MISILVSINVVIFSFIGNFLWTQHKKIQNLAELLSKFEKSLEQMTQDHRVLINADLVFSKQMQEINTQLVSMDNQLQGIENQRSNDGGYQHAMKILEMGGNRDEIVDSCHLSHAEAEFLMNLQAYRSAMKSL